MLDLPAADAAFSGSVAAVRSQRDVISLAGPDAATYLQGQVSQDVAALAVGASAPTFILQPQGKVDAWGRLSRLAEDRFWFDLDAGFGAVALDRLNRFKLRVKLDIELLGPLDVVAVRGPDAARGPEALGFSAGDGVVVLDWAEGRERGGIGFDVVDAAGVGLAIPAAVPEAPAEALESLRIRLGLPAMGHELDADTIPAAAGVVPMSVAFAKGCYVGQELVARVDSRGSRTPTQLWLLEVGAATGVDAAGLAPGAEVRWAGEAVGHLTSVASAGAGGAVALAYLKRSVTGGGPAEVVGSDGRPVAVEVRPLPIAGQIS